MFYQVEEEGIVAQTAKMRLTAIRCFLTTVDVLATNQPASASLSIRLAQVKHRCLWLKMRVPLSNRFY